MSTTFEVRVPDIGDFKDVPVLEILVEPGALVELEAPLITLESEKATIDVPAPARGIVQEITVRKGQRVSQGAPILTLRSPDDDSARIVDISVPAPTRSSMPSPPATQSADSHTAAALERRAYAGPAVRTLCRLLGVDPTSVTGSGPRGRISKEDVHLHVQRLGEAAKARQVETTARHSRASRIDFERFGPIDRQPLSRIAKAAAENLERNWARIPHVTNFEEVDVTELEAFRDRVNRERQADIKLTMLSFLIKAAAAALREHPKLNASLDGDTLVVKRYCHIGFAIDTPAGLLVPVIRDADRKGLLQIAGEAHELAARAREGKLKLADMEGGCFTVSSLGGIPGTGFTPIINAPEIAILGAARARMLPRWDGSQFAPRLMLPLSLSWDHRALSGAAAARFLAFIAAQLNDLPRLLL